MDHHGGVGLQGRQPGAVAHGGGGEDELREEKARERAQQGGEREVLQEDVPRVLDHLVPGEVPETLGRGPQSVGDDRLGRQHRPPAAQAGPEREVDVLQVGEEALVEQADLVEDVPPVHRRSARRREHLGHLAIAVLVTKPSVPRVRDAPLGEEVAGGVEDAGVPMVHDLGGGDVRHGHGRRQMGEPLGVGHGVVVEKGDEPAAGGIDASVDAPREAVVAIEGHDPHPRVSLPEKLDGTVGRAVVDDDDFEVAE